MTWQPLSIGKVLQVANLVNNISPDLIILNHTPLMNFALPLIQGGIRVSVLHSDDPVFYATAALHSQYLDAWVAPSPGVKERFSKWIPKKRKANILLIPHGVDTSIFSPNDGRHHDHSEVTFVGFLGINKGVDLLPEIFKAITLKVPKTKFNIVGEGPMKVDLMKRMDELGIGPQCYWPGAISQISVASILRKSAVCVHPTRIEGFGLIIAEAMLSGALPVVSRISGVTDFVVEDKVSGFLPDIGDVNAFVDSISMILNEPQMQESMRAAALSRARSLFSRESMLSKYELLTKFESNRSKSPVNLVRWVWETTWEMRSYRLRVPKLKLRA